MDSEAKKILILSGLTNLVLLGTLAFKVLNDNAKEKQRKKNHKKPKKKKR